MPKALFVDLIADFYDQHGIYALSSVLRKQSVSASFLAERNYPRALSKAIQFAPEILLYSSFSFNLNRYIQFDRDIKSVLKNSTSLIGGPGPTFSPFALQQTTIDALCLGEGETAIEEYFKSGFQPQKNIVATQNLSLPQEYYPLVNLDQLPFPDREIIYRADSLLRDAPSKQFFSGRGCPYDCTYCFNHTFKRQFHGCGPIIRKKSVEYLLDEIQEVKKRYSLANIVFNDDVFILDKKWLFEFCRRFPKEIGLPYTCNIRANLIDEEVVGALSESGCRAVNWSIESGNDDLRNRVLKRNMSDAQIIKAGQLLKKYGIRHRIGNLIGLPTERFEQMLQTVELNIQAQPTLAVANIFVPFPGLELTEYAVQEGCLDHEALQNLPSNFYQQSVLKMTPEEELRLKKLMGLFNLFVQVPPLFHHPWIQRLCFKTPHFILWIANNFLYAYSMMKLYVVKAPVILRLRMAWRFFKIQIT